MKQETETTDAALPARRRTDLIELVRARGQATVADLCAVFDVSADTIRRDLDLLSREGLLRRTHGGAVPAVLVNQDTPFAQRLNTQKGAKHRIGRAAAGLISSGETLLVNGGSTAMAFAESLGGLSGLTLVTNNLRLPDAVPEGVARDFYLLGGELRREAQVTIGPVAFASTGRINADTAVIGVGGITAEGGMSTTLLVEASMIAAMMEAAKRTIVIADAEKLGRNSFAHIAPLDRIDVLVTDRNPPEDIRQLLDETEIELIVAGD